MSRVIHRRTRIFVIKPLIPGASEKLILLVQSSVPTTDTGAQAEKAKTCKGKPIKGIRQISPVTSVEGMSIFVL